MDPLTIAAIGSTVIGGAYSAFNDWRQNRQRKELAKYEFKQNQRAWELNNQYNTPLAQMQRFQAAGLNPALMYGQGTPGNSNSAPKYEAPEYNATAEPPRIMETIGQFQNTKIQQLTQKQIDAQTKATDAQRLKTQAETINAGIQSGILKSNALTAKIRANFARELQQSQLDINLQTHQNLEAQGKILEFDRQMKEIDAKWKQGGINPTDALPFRLISQWMQDNAYSPTQIIDFWKRYPTIFHWLERDENQDVLDPFGAAGNRRTGTIKQ